MICLAARTVNEARSRVSAVGFCVVEWLGKTGCHATPQIMRRVFVREVIVPTQFLTVWPCGFQGHPPDRHHMAPRRRDSPRLPGLLLLPIGPGTQEPIGRHTSITSATEGSVGTGPAAGDRRFAHHATGPRSSGRPGMCVFQSYNVSPAFDVSRRRKKIRAATPRDHVVKGFCLCGGIEDSGTVRGQFIDTWSVSAHTAGGRADFFWMNA